MEGKAEVSEFWLGWEEALDLVQKKVSSAFITCDSHTKPMDILLDLQNDISNMRILHETISNL